MGDEAFRQTSTQNKPPTQNLSTNAECIEHAAFGNIPEYELHHTSSNNTSTTTAGSSQNIKGAS
jgi:hypothetical protein